MALEPDYSVVERLAEDVGFWDQFWNQFIPVSVEMTTPPPVFGQSLLEEFRDQIIRSVMIPAAIFRGES